LKGVGDIHDCNKQTQDKLRNNAKKIIKGECKYESL